MKIKFYTLLFLLNLGLYAQNSDNSGIPIPNDFVINGDFEQSNNLPDNISQLFFALNWIDNSNSEGSPDYFHQQSFPGSQPVNPTNGGNAYAGFGTSPIGNTVFTENIATQLQSPLAPGTQYTLSFDVLRRTVNSGDNHITFQAFLSNTWISVQGNGPVPTTNGILLTNPNGVSSNTAGWNTITIPFTTSGNAGQQFLYIGAFSNTQFQNPNAVGLPTYYYIDNVSLVQGTLNCNNESISITTEFPDCNIFENSNTFDVCGTFTTSANADSYNLSLNTDDLDDDFPFPTNTPITNIFNVTTNSGVTSGNFCVTLNQNNFNTNNNYQINAQINSQINGQPCNINTINTPLPFEDCSSPCPDCNNDILENIAINEAKGCGMYEIRIPELFDCYKVVYFINDVEQGNLSEGISPINFDENGSYIITYAVIDIETGKPCAKDERKVSVDCFDDVCPDCNNDILENIIIQEAKGCGKYEIRVPQLFDCYKVVYSINGGEENSISEGITHINIEENGSYVIYYEVIDIETGKPCAKNERKINVNCFDEPCPHCNSDIANNITIEPAEDCGVFEFNIPELSNCFEVVYSVNNIDQGNLPEGTSDLIFNENDLYNINIFVIDTETDKICAVREHTLNIDCFDEPGPNDCIDNPTLENLLATNLKNILNEILTEDNGYTGTCVSGDTNTWIDITNMSAIMVFMEEYDLEERLQNAIDTRQLALPNYDASTYTVNITHVYYKWGKTFGSNSIDPACLTISFRNQSINETGPMFYYRFSGELDPTLIQEFTNIELNAEELKATFNYIGIDGQTNSLYDILQPFSLVEGTSQEYFQYCWFHDLDYAPRLTNDVIELYPNPVNDILNIESKNLEMTSLSIHDLTGKPIKILKSIKGFKQKLEVSDLRKGYYILKVILSDGSVQHKNIILK